MRQKIEYATINLRFEDAKQDSQKIIEILTQAGLINDSYHAKCVRGKARRIYITKGGVTIDVKKTGINTNIYLDFLRSLTKEEEFYLDISSLHYSSY